jgi:cytochrome c553
MKRILSIALFLAGAASLANAQIGVQTNDVLGAHLNYGRGCAGCHAPHSGAAGNGLATKDTTTGNIALWGEDLNNLYGVSITTGQSEHGSYAEVLPSSITAGTPDVAGVLMCLSCHDGNLAQGAHMQGTVYETLPPTYGAAAKSIPTLLGNDGSTPGNYLNDHPVGTNAVIGCGGSYNWDCTVNSVGKIVPGPKMTQFITNYGFFVSPAVVNNKPTVMCTTCHNQHVMNVVTVKTGAISTSTDPTVVGTLGGGNTLGLPTGTYATMFFLRGPYNPASTTPNSNQTAQFCRQCHGGEANEMLGSTAGTTF